MFSIRLPFYSFIFLSGFCCLLLAIHFVGEFVLLAHVEQPFVHTIYIMYTYIMHVQCIKQIY